MRSTRLTVAISVALTLGLAACAPKPATAPEGAVHQEAQPQAPQRMADTTPVDKDKKAEARDASEADAMRSSSANGRAQAATPSPVVMQEAPAALMPPPALVAEMRGLAQKTGARIKKSGTIRQM